MNYFKKCLQPEIWLVLTAFFLPISVAATNICCVLLLLTGITHYKKIPFSYAHPFLLLLLLPVLGVLVTQAPIEAISETGRDMLKVGYALAILSIGFSAQTQKNAITAFIAAMILTLILGSIKHIAGLNWSPSLTSAAIFHSHIKTNYLMAMAAYLLALEYSSKKRWIWIAAMMVYGFVFSASRTGYMVWLLLILFTAWQFYRPYFIKIAVVLPIIFGLLVIASPTLYNRMENIVTDMHALQEGKRNTSLGERLSFLNGSYNAFIKKPWTGYGTGSFEQTYNAQAQQLGLPKSSNPHNEYVNMAIQYGIFGVLVFVYFLVYFYRLSDPKSAVRGHIVAFASGCMLNAWLMDFVEGTFFCVLLAILLLPGRKTCTHL